jgi:glycosyltransferase involved in cell wall biosynthesis
MKILSLSLDKKIFEPQSSVAQRTIFLAKQVDKYLVIVPAKEQKIELSAQVTAWGIAGANKVASLFNIYKTLNSLLEKEKFDLLTVQDSGFLGFLGLVLAKKFHLKYEVQIHGFEKNNILRDYLAKQCLANADLVRVVSTRLKKQIKEKYHLFAGKIYVAPVVVDTSHLVNSSTIDLHKVYPNHFIFLTVGRLVPVKNIALQLRAIKKLNNKDKVKLIVVGDGPEKDCLKKLTNDLGISEQVIFYGWQEKLGDLYYSADCLLLTSDSEGYGLVAVEAINCNLPLIMTDVGCAHEVIKDHVNGLIIPINNEMALLEAMNKIQQGDILKGLKNNISQQKKINNQETFEIIINKWSSLL